MAEAAGIVVDTHMHLHPRDHAPCALIKPPDEGLPPHLPPATPPAGSLTPAW